MSAGVQRWQDAEGHDVSTAMSERSRYANLLARAEVAERQYDEAVAALMEYLRAHADRTVDKPYEICGNLDSYWLNEDTGEDGYRVQCQFPKNHWDELGITYHYDNGDEWIGGTWPKADG